MHAIQSNFQACLILPLQKCTFLLPQRPHGQAGLFITRLCSLPLVSPSQHPPVARVKAFVGHSALPRSFLLSSRQNSCFMQSLVIAHVVDYPSLSLFFPKTMAPWRTRLWMCNWSDSSWPIGGALIYAIWVKWSLLRFISTSQITAKH